MIVRLSTVLRLFAAQAGHGHWSAVARPPGPVTLPQARCQSWRKPCEGASSAIVLGPVCFERVHERQQLGLGDQMRLSFAKIFQHFFKHCVADSAGNMSRTRTGNFFYAHGFGDSLACFFAITKSFRRS